MRPPVPLINNDRSPEKHVWMPWRIKSQDWVIQCHPCSSDCLMLKGWSCAFCVVSLKVAPLVLASKLESWNGGHQEWCWSWKSATPEACCFRREAASVEVQSRCWSSALVGVAFLMCCLSVEHGQTVLARAGGGQDIWRGGVDVEAKLLEDLAEGFGPLQSAYNAKDIGLLLQLAMAFPVIWSHLSATRSLAFQLLTEGHIGWLQWQSEGAKHHKVLAGQLQVEPGWELLWIELKTPPLYVESTSLPLSPQHLREGAACFGDLNIQTMLEIHTQRVRDILAAPNVGVAQAVWELSRELTRVSQSLVFLTMCPYLLKTGSGIQRELRLAEPPLFRNACCERYRILSWLLTELWKDLGSPTLAYVELGVAAGSTALFLLERLPWLHAYLVENQPRKELLDALPAFSGRADLLKMDSKEAAQEFLSAQIRVDAIFLDADHSFHGVTADLEDFGQLSPALVMGHDFSWEHPGVVQAALQHSRISGCPLTLAPDHVFFWDWRVQSFNSSTCFGTSKKLKGVQLDGSGEKAVEEDHGTTKECN